MTTLSIQSMDPSRPLVVELGRVLPRPLTPDEFWDVRQANPELHIESTATGELVIMTPAGAGSGRRNMRLAIQLGNWSLRDGTGEAFDSSAGYRLSNGACRSPDVSWVLKERWDAVSVEDQERYPELTPDFVAEVRSRSDRLTELQAKMIEYRDCGVRLGWLLDPQSRIVWIYEPGAAIRRCDDPSTLDGGEVLPGFVLDVRAVWAER